MSDLNTLISEVEMAKQNKADIIQALKDCGEPVEDTSTLEDIAHHVNHCAPFDGVYLATIIRSGENQGKRKFFTREEWAALSSSQQTAYAKIGCLLVAEGHKLLISPSYQTKAEGSSEVTRQWSSAYTAVANLKAYNDTTFGVLNDFDSEGNTDKIITYANLETTTVTFPAATRARAYKACTLANGGYDDDTKWSLPSMGHARLMMSHLKELNSAFNHFFAGGTIVGGNHWSSNDYDAWANAWYFEPVAGTSGVIVKNYSSCRVRPVSAIDSL